MTSGALDGLVRQGMTVAVSDGVGMPGADVLADLSAAAAAAGDVRLVLGWCLRRPDGLDLDAFVDVRTVLGGYGLRRAIDAGRVRYLPVRFGAVPALVRDVLRPDLLVVTVASGAGGYRLRSEVSWLRAAVDAGATVAAVTGPPLPCCDAGPPLPADRVVPVGATAEPPFEVAEPSPSDAHRRIAELVAPLIPAGARVQYPPGAMGAALLDAIDVPVRIDAGLLTPGVVGLDRRGLLADTPVAAYLIGDAELYEWSGDRPLLHPFEVTHDPGRLAADPFVAVNTALQVDRAGQVNVESIGGSAVAGIGGQPDYAFAATACPGGLSVLAVPSEAAGVATLVDQFATPVSTPAHDFDVVVTERGSADLRGLDRVERADRIAGLWDGR